MIFLANKPINISSNNFAQQLGRKLKVKLGYSGTLDPFASGALLCADKKHTKLFRFLNTEPKVYQATIWLGATSPSLDNENITLQPAKKIDIKNLQKAFLKFQGEISYIPPDFCAKKINGQRAYELARKNQSVTLAPCIMNVKSELLHYIHPFITFKLSASKGTYVRSYAQLICNELGEVGTLSALKRISEGSFINFKNYNAFDSVNLKENYYFGDLNDIYLGKKLEINNFKFKIYDTYKIDLGNYFSIININKTVKYVLNKVEKC